MAIKSKKATFTSVFFSTFTLPTGYVLSFFLIYIMIYIIIKDLHYEDTYASHYSIYIAVLFRCRRILCRSYGPFLCYVPGNRKLPEIEIRKPKNILAKDTVTSMQGGLVYGYIGQTEYIIRKMKEESGLGKINVVATGGLGKMIAKETSFINYYDANLTLKGLQIIYDKQKQD